MEINFGWCKDWQISILFVSHSTAIASKVRIFEVWLIGDSLEM